MKLLKNYYAHFICYGFILFCLTCAYFSEPMLPEFEIEFKSSPVEKNYEKTPKPAPVNKDIRYI